MIIELRDSFVLTIQKSRLQWLCSVTNLVYAGRGRMEITERSNSMVSLDAFYANELRHVPKARGIMRLALCAFLSALDRKYTHMTLTASASGLNELVDYYKRSYGFRIDTEYGSPEEQYDNGLVEMTALIKTMASKCGVL